MTLKDTGPSPQSFDLETETRDNNKYRAVAWSGRYLQVTLMSIPPGGDIGLESHPETDQFLRLDAGRGRVQMGASQDRLTFDREASDGWCILVPAGTWHNVTNIGAEPMQLYAVYAPSHHKPGKVHDTAANAAADTDDEPADGSVQPSTRPPDGHAQPAMRLNGMQRPLRARRDHRAGCRLRHLCQVASAQGLTRRTRRSLWSRKLRSTGIVATG